MQTLFGIIVGIFLTIGVAYIHDASITAPALDSNTNTTVSNTTVAERQMVNWDVVGTNWRQLKSSVAQGWHKLQSIG